MNDGLVSKKDLTFANDSLLCFCNRFELPNDAGPLEYSCSKVVLSEDETRPFFLIGLFFALSLRFFSLFLLCFVLKYRVLFADFVALGKILVRSHCFPIFAWRNCLRQDQAQVEELTRF